MSWKDESTVLKTIVFFTLENSIGLMEALLPYVWVERDRDRGTKLVYVFLAKVQSSHRLTAQ